jgi:hypothetical protein
MWWNGSRVFIKNELINKFLFFFPLPCRANLYPQVGGMR